MYPDTCIQNQSGVVCWSNAFFKIHEWFDVKPSLTKNQIMFWSAVVTNVLSTLFYL